MARLIAGLSENQIRQSLIGAGYSDAEVLIFTEKLISRRDWMVKDLGLADEISLLRPEGAREDLSYDSTTMEPVETTLNDGRVVTAVTAPELIISEGMIKPRE